MKKLCKVGGFILNTVPRTEYTFGTGGVVWGPVELSKVVAGWDVEGYAVAVEIPFSEKISAILKESSKKYEKVIYNAAEEFSNVSTISVASELLSKVNQLVKHMEQNDIEAIDVLYLEAIKNNISRGA